MAVVGRQLAEVARLETLTETSLGRTGDGCAGRGVQDALTRPAIGRDWKSVARDENGNGEQGEINDDELVIGIFHER